MSEGFFTPQQLQVPGLAADDLCAALVRILPRTILQLDIVESAEVARAQGRNESMPDGSEHWFRYFTQEDMARCADPGFAAGMVRHEFCELVRAGASFPQTVALQGGGTGFAIDANGLVLTNYHLVISEVANYERELGVLNQEVLCRSLKAQVAQRQPDGTWQWQDAAAVWLVSNPPSARALSPDETGLLHPREDTALLRVEPAPSSWLPLSTRAVAQGEPVWMAGFPLRSARGAEALRRHGYADADGSLRVSSGAVTVATDDNYFESDLDGSMGNSGSPVFDASGKVVGLFSRATGDGPRNAVEYGHVSRVLVKSRMAVEGLGLAALLPDAPGRDRD
ncbi:MAG: trypsin-like peptidase domain-containing protein [Betaproteobacteria bacterium]|nr:trypsin-like peptidase domain-containing protein [Betaproteobacteria bacterium]